MTSATVRLKELLRPDIMAMEEYTPIVPFEVLSRQLGIPETEIVKLDANENPYGPAPSVYEALYNSRRYNIYPDPGQTLLREAIEPYIGLSQEHVVFGNGSDELIDLTMRLFVTPGDMVVNLPPTFGMYSYNTSLCAGRLLEVRRRDDFSIDIDQVFQAVASSPSRVKMVFLNSPNNPDGGLVARDDLERLLELPAIIVLDEAYAEFAGESNVDLVPQHWNLVVLRTFSKWAGLGGLRIGYGVYPRELCQQLWKIKPPYSVNVAAQEAALASLAEKDYLMGNVERIVAERERLFALLAETPGLIAYPSRANFILCRLLNARALRVKQRLARRGILVRHFDKPGLRDCIRVSIGKPKQNDLFLANLREILAETEH